MSQKKYRCCTCFACIGQRVQVGVRQCQINNETAATKRLANATTHWTAYLPQLYYMYVVLYFGAIFFIDSLKNIIIIYIHNRLVPQQFLALTLPPPNHPHPDAMIHFEQSPPTPSTFQLPTHLSSITYAPFSTTEPSPCRVQPCVQRGLCRKDFIRQRQQRPPLLQTL